MALDINGFTLSKSTNFLIGASGTNIDSGGRIVIPNNPAASGTTAVSGSAANQYPQVINSMTVNSGAWTGNTTFTAPVAGLYFVSTAVIINGTGDTATPTNIYNAYLGVVKNGALYGYGSSQTNDSWSPMLFQTLIYLNVGDTVAIAVNASPIPVGNSPGFYQSNHGSLAITLIG